MRPQQRLTPASTVGYDESRLQIKNGDVLMYRGRSLESRIIQWATRSRYSHAGLAVWWNDRLMVMEAVGRGVIVTALSKNVVSYPGDVEWFTSVEELPDEDRQRMVEFAQQELGKDYALWRAILLGFRLLLQHDVDKRDRLRREARLFCSHYVAETYNAIGKDLKKGVSDRFMSPGDIASSSILRRIGALRKRGIQTRGWLKSK
ncbi:MAG: YiiX/YebB-like N1pC/P60 family cysteine hydrolase [Bacteroidota bacterium]